MRDSQSPRLDSERGQVLIHVAFALLALLAISGFVVEHGLMWTARVQAQAAADAGALAGAGTLEADLTNTTGATQAAQFFAGKTAVWGRTTAPADVVLSPLPYNGPA